MPTQCDPVSPDEFVYRRIPGGNPSFYNPRKSRPVTVGAFSPSDLDTDGLSVFRALFTTPDEVARLNSKPYSFYIARLRVSDILELGVSVIPDPLPDPPFGHSLIPEMNPGNSTGDGRELFRRRRRALADLSGLDIVMHPGVP